MSLRRQQGEFDIFYWSRFEPTSGTNPKQNPGNYSRAGLMSDLSDEISNETQSTLDRASGQHESVIYGQQSSSEDLTFNVQESRDSGGSITNDPTVQAASQGASSVTIDTDTDDEVSLSAGDMITFGSHDYHYLVRSSLTLGVSSSGSVDISPKLQTALGGGNQVSIVTDAEDPVQLVLRDSSLNQREGWWLINPEDGDGNTQTGLEGVHGRAVIESINNTRNTGEFKQFEASLTNQIAPTYFTT